jgi:hypothetical protein
LTFSSLYFDIRKVSTNLQRRVYGTDFTLGGVINNSSFEFISHIGVNFAV